MAQDFVSQSSLPIPLNAPIHLLCLSTFTHPLPACQSITHLVNHFPIRSPLLYLLPGKHSILTMTDTTDMRPEECPLGLQLDRLSLSSEEREERVIPKLQGANHDFAFAFDIDGVLMRGKLPLDGAKQTLETLQANSIPFILLTNGGGLTELDHAARLGLRLTMDIDEDQFVQSHTPFKTFVEHYKDEWIVVLGGHGSAVKELAAMYGFNPEKILTSSDIVKHHASIHPFPVRPTDNTVFSFWTYEHELTFDILGDDFCLPRQVRQYRR